MKGKLLLVFMTGFLILSCRTNDLAGIDFRQEMRNLVIDLSSYARGKDAGFIIVPQNGQEIVSTTGEGGGDLYTNYLAALDGTGREDLNYGYTDDNVATPLADHSHMLALCSDFSNEGKTVLVTDYCRDHDKSDAAYNANLSEGFVTFTTGDRDLATLPDYPLTPRDVNSNNILTLSDASNFLYIINDENYSGKSGFLSALQGTDYDVLIIDLFCCGEELTASDVQSLKTKQNGGSRLVLCYMSIGEAENYRWYWQSAWNINRPDWLERENPDWPGNYKVRYWSDEWRSILMGSSDSYLDKILNAGFDGAYLDIIDAFEYFEEL